MTAKSDRLVSLDALRGFDMFWITGGSGIVYAIHHLANTSFTTTLARHMEHAEWNGFLFFDLIFPLFLFIAGVSFPFSLISRRAKGQANSAIYKHILFRAAALVFLGLVYNGLFWFDFANLRVASVLGRIGLAWAAAAIIAMHVHPKALIIWILSILLSYWAILMLIPVPGFGAGNLTTEGSIVAWFDQNFLPGKLYLGVHDPEGLLSTFPSVATALIGMVTGYFIKSRMDTSRIATGLWMVLAGFLLFGISWIWDLVLPINKNLWTSSFVFCAGGLSLVLLGLFFTIIDGYGLKTWAFPFVVIGMNPITIYIAQAGLINFRDMTNYFFGGLASYAGPWGELIQSTTYVGFSWLFLYFLYRNKWFLKV